MARAKTIEGKVFEAIENGVRMRDWNRYDLAAKLVNNLRPEDVVPIATAIIELSAIKYRMGDFEGRESYRWLKIASRLEREILDTDDPTV
jgi:hypothetical protein